MAAILARHSRSARPVDLCDLTEMMELVEVRRCGKDRRCDGTADGVAGEGDTLILSGAGVVGVWDARLRPVANFEAFMGFAERTESAERSALVFLDSAATTKASNASISCEALSTARLGLFVSVGRRESLRVRFRLLWGVRGSTSGC